MVKKVYDIIPPAPKEDDNRQEIDFGQTEAAPVDEPQRPRITYIPRNEESAKERTKGRGAPSSFVSFVAKAAVVVGLVALLMFAVDYRFGRAVIKIWPATELAQADAKISVDPAAKEIVFERKAIPGIAVTAEKNFAEEFTASGEKSNQAKAGGTIKIFNDYSSPQRLIKGTRFQAPLDKFQPALAKDEAPWFKTTEDVYLAPKSSATVSVIADSPGEKYNISPSVFSIPGLVGTAQYTFVYGKSYEKFAGGSDQAAAEVLTADLDKAKEAITAKVQEETPKELVSQVPPGYVIIDQTVKVDVNDIMANVAAGASAAKFIQQAKGKATAIAYRISDLDKMGKDLMMSKVGVGHAIYEASLKVGQSYFGMNAANGLAELTLNVSAQVYPKANEDELRKGLAGKPRTAAQLFLTSLPKTKSVKIDLTPPWKTKIPNEPEKIVIQTLFE